MENKNPKTPKKKTNLLVIAVLVLLAAGLFIASKFLQSPNGNLTQDEIQAQMTALASQETARPAPTETPAVSSPENTQTGKTEDNLAEAYLFIIVNNRVYGIEALGEERDVTVDQGDGVVNVIHLLPDGFYMASSTCENQLCVSEGTVTIDNYQRRILGSSVYCLPHGVQLELVVPSHTPDPNAPDI